MDLFSDGVIYGLVTNPIKENKTRKLIHKLGVHINMNNIYLKMINVMNYSQVHNTHHSQHYNGKYSE